MAQRLRHHIDEFQASISQIERCEKRKLDSCLSSYLYLLTVNAAVIAVLHGVSFGLALDMVLCADIRFCAASTRFAVKEIDIGLAADIGTLTRLPKANVPMSFIKDVALTARVFDAKEALTAGLVSAVYETKAEALVSAVNKAELIAGKSPVAVMGTKEVINYSRDHSVQDGECLFEVLRSKTHKADTPISRSEICFGVECCILSDCGCDGFSHSRDPKEKAEIREALVDSDGQSD